MDENLSWQARLVKANINITHIDYDHNMLYLDFAYRPRSGQPQKWMKTVFSLDCDYNIGYTTGVSKYINWEKTAEEVCKEVLKLRKELEG